MAEFVREAADEALATKTRLAAIDAEIAKILDITLTLPSSAACRGWGQHSPNFSLRQEI